MSTEIRPLPEGDPSSWTSRAKAQCNHPERNPPTLIYIPRGHEMVHTCPACGKVTTIANRTTFDL